MKKIIILHNIISPYKILLFNALSRQLQGKLEIVYFAETAANREWHINYDNIQFSYRLLNKGSLDDVSGAKLAKQVLMYLYKNKADIGAIVAGEYNGLAYWSAWLWAWQQGINFGSIMESTEYDHKRRWFKEKIKSLFFAHCQFVFAAGYLHKRYVNNLGVPNNCIYVVGGVGGVDEVIYEPFRKKASQCSKSYLQQELNLPNKNYFIYVGRFSTEKNLLKLLEAYAIFKRNNIEWGLLLVGSGPQEKQLKEYALNNDISDVVFSGFIQQEQLPLYYLSSEVFILPSTSETWGLVVDEAMTLDLPILISNRCGCVGELLQNGKNGYFFDPADVRQMSNFMQEIAINKDLRKNMGKKSRLIISQYSSKHSAEIMATKLIDFI